MSGTLIGTTQAAEFRRRLELLAAELSAELQQRRGELAAEHAATSNTFVAGSEGAAVATDDDRALALMRHEAQELAEVRNALARLDAGTYGFCSRCGDPIGEPRLAALPTARLCLACQSAAEHPAPRS